MSGGFLFFNSVVSGVFIFCNGTSQMVSTWQLSLIRLGDYFGGGEGIYLCSLQGAKQSRCDIQETELCLNILSPSVKACTCMKMC